MRYPAAEKLEIIRLVEQSALPVRRTLEKIGIPRATFYRWYDLYRTGGPEALDPLISVILFTHRVRPTVARGGFCLCCDCRRFRRYSCNRLLSFFHGPAYIRH